MNARTLKQVSPRRARNPWVLQLAFIVAHVLVVAMPKHSSIVTWHARGALAFGVLTALFARSPVRVAYAAAYLTGAEVFWRMKKAGVPWEIGKYGVILICLISLARSGRLRRIALPFVYFLLLVPSSLLTVSNLNDRDARDQLSFNLAGPLALAVCAVFFSNLRMSRSQLQWLCVCVIGPAVGVAAVGAYNVQAFSPIEFASDSNAVASGGFGPNQVSAILGVGIIMTCLYLLLRPPKLPVVGAMLALLLFLVGQCAVTFSRAGLYMSVASIAAACFFLFRDSRYRRRLFATGVAVLVLLIFVVIPRLETITGGAITERFEDTQLTGRTELMEADLETFSKNPILGVGPGLGGAARRRAYYVTTAHTEYTRLLAEHGILGLASIAVLVAMALQDLRRARDRVQQAFAAALLAFGFLYLATDATRMVAPSFAFGLAGVSFAVARRRRIPIPAPRSELLIGRTARGPARTFGPGGISA